MRQSPRMLRLGIVAALLLPTGAVVLSGNLQAQMRPIPKPQFQRVWKCGKCNNNIGTGAFPPGTCPVCGVKIVNGIDRPNGNPVPPNNAVIVLNPNPEPVLDRRAANNVPPPPASRLGLIIVLLVVGGVIALACLGALGFGIYLYVKHSK